MKTVIINTQTMLKGVRRFVQENTITPPILEVTALAGNVDDAIDAIDEAASDQTGGMGEVAGAVVTKKEKAKALRDYLKDVGLVARSLDHDAHPGVAARFVLPRTRSYPALAAYARNAIEEATAIQADLVARGLSATFLADLNALLAAFEAGEESKISGLQTQVGGTSGLGYRAMVGLRAATKLDAIFRAHFRSDPVTLAVWKHARHVERPAPAEPTNPPGSGEDSGSGSGGGDAGSGSGTAAIVTPGGEGSVIA
jgi:hypothetical protein